MTEVVRIVIEIEKNEAGDIRTSHRFMTGTDEAVAKRWPSGGLVYIAHAMFVEALRKETYMMIISKLSQGEKGSDLDEKGVSDAVRAHWTQQLNALVGQAARSLLRAFR